MAMVLLRYCLLPITILVLLLSLTSLVSTQDIDEDEEPPRRFVQPVNVGLDFTLPFDISNTLRTVLGGPVSVLVAIALGLVLLMGILNVPLGLILGWRGIGRGGRNSRCEEVHWSRSLEDLQFEDAFLFWKDKSEECRQKVVCHAHSVLVQAPALFQTAFRLVSPKIRNAAAYKEAIVFGLRRGDCERRFWRCTKSLIDLLPQVTCWKKILQPFTVKLWEKKRVAKTKRKRHSRSSTDRSEL